MRKGDKMEKNVCGLENIYNKEVWELFKKYHKNKKKEKRERMKTLILKNLVLGKHFRVYVPEDYRVKLGDRVYGWDSRCVVVKILEHKREKKKKKLDPFIEKRRPKGVMYSEFAALSWGFPDINEINKILESLKQSRGAVTEFKSTSMGKNYIYGLYEELYEEMKEEIKKEKEKEAQEKQALSDFHKRPYFKTIVEEVKGKPRGKENLKKIKFPCYCSYHAGGRYGRWLGEINKSWKRGEGNRYYLSSVNEQRAYSMVDDNSSLDDLMKDYDIEILKGELKLWKEVK